MKKGNKKLAVVLTLVTAGSIFYATAPASAKGMELEGVEIVFGRHHDAPPPPPPPPHHYHDMHMPPPPPPHAHHHHHMPPHRGPEMWAHRPGGPGPEPRHENFGPHDRMRGPRPEPQRGQGHMPQPHR